MTYDALSRYHYGLGVGRVAKPIVPQVARGLQGFVHPLPLQNATLAVADRQFVLGALRQVGPPVYTVQGPPQILKTRLVQ